MNLATLIRNQEIEILAPILLLQQAEHTFSAIKLAYAAIDTLSFAYYQKDDPSGFKAWISKFMKPSRLGVSRDQIWENRNGLLHTSTSSSKRTKKLTVTELDFKHDSFNLWGGVVKMQSPHTPVNPDQYLTELIDAIKFFFQASAQWSIRRQYQVFIHLLATHAS